MEKPIYVTGHKNPDSDSICAAICYSYLKNKLGFNTIPVRLSPLNKETSYILDKFKVDRPIMIHSAKCTLAEIDMDEALLVNRKTTMKEALDAILKRKNKGVFVVDENNHLEGVVSTSNLTNLWTADEQALEDLMSRVPLENIIKTTKATLIYDAPFKPNGKVNLLPNLGYNNQIEPGTIVIAGNHPDIQRSVIEQKAALLIICGENWVDSITMTMAKEKQVPIIHTHLSAITIAHSIFQSPSIEEVMTTNVSFFRSNETVDGASMRIAKTRFRTYPVLNENDEVIGAISRYHLFNYKKKQFILVDHNESGQSVNDLEFGEVIEIVDHHRLGGIQTQSPIQFVNQIVGSTCTIVTGLYRQYRIEIPENIAGLLLAGIVSDTMNLKSPTTTKIDIDQALYLSKKTGISINDLADELVQTSDSLLKKTHQELMYEDFKEFRLSDSKIAIGQVVCKSSKEYKKIKDKFLTYLEDQNVTHRYDLLLILFTDPTGKGSHFLYTGKKSWIVEEGFKSVLIDDFAPGFISRKKQVLPIIIDTLNK
ncbi:MAG: putative manganese-dependent inorganic diphosphatase [Erysipelotrichaceae bacterium]|nr:putative manganese-dependent inorganic diphosphatase [Erysipelotrichaceae bacterium]